MAHENHLRIRQRPAHASLVRRSRLRRTTQIYLRADATVPYRTKVTKGQGSRADLAIALKLSEYAQARWRAVNARHLVALVGAGARFERGKLTERELVDSDARAA